MKSLFKKQSGVALRSTYYLLIRNKWAKKMGSLTLGLSRNKLTFLLAGFVVISCSLILLIICKGFKSDASHAINNIAIAKVSTTAIQIKSNVLKPLLISRQQYSKIVAFKSYMDSLRKNPSGKRTYDSIERLRPGLLDSVAFIENYMKSNVKE